MSGNGSYDLRELQALRLVRALLIQDRDSRNEVVELAERLAQSD